MRARAESHPDQGLPSPAGPIGRKAALALRRGFVAECRAATVQGGSRTRNEDAHLCALPTLAVADGVGGRPAGHLASWIAVGVMASAGRSSTNPPDQLRSGFEEANAAIRSLAADPAYGGAATTLTCARFVPGGAWIAHLGDSRAYRVRGGEIDQLTVDHSLVGELRRRGTITPEQAACHPMRGAITRGLGIEEQARPDLFRADLAPGDTLLLCSDGLSKAMADSELAGPLSSRLRLQAAVEGLLGAARQRVGDDVTLVAARVGAA